MDSKNNFLVCFIKSMLSLISKTELAKRARRMRATKDTLTSKEVAPTGVVLVQFEQDERTTSDPVLKERD